jgi:hypothetical protein
MMNDDGAHLRQAPPNLPTLGIKKMNEKMMEPVIIRHLPIRLHSESKK